MTTAAEIIAQAQEDGVKLQLLDTGSIKAIGKAHVVDYWLPIIRHNKPAVIQELAKRRSGTLSLTQEFMKNDGLSDKDAMALAAVSVQPRPTEEWLTMIAELDLLIDKYCTLSGLSAEAIARIMEARLKQPLLSIPVSLEWFCREVNKMSADEDGR